MPSPSRFTFAATAAWLALATLCTAGSTGVARAAGAAGTKPDPQTLALCSRCPAPTVFRSSGIGTANAVAEARMGRDDLTGTDGPCPNADAKCLETELRRVYKASADCTVGRITTVEGTRLTLAGVWDDSDVGGGRTMWRGADGQVVGRDNASNGLAVSAQWEVLCPGPVSAKLIARANAAARPAAAHAPAAPPSRAAAAPPVCTAGTPCAEVGRFAMTVTDFRASLAQPTKVLTVTTRFESKSDRPVILAYVPGSGAAIDERGNRYAINDADVRGIGLITSRAVDDKFVLEPGQGSDARFTYVWGAGREVYGTVFDIELTVREVRPLGNGQLELGAEHPLRIAGLRDGARAAAPVATSGTGATPVRGGGAAVETPSAVDHCAGVRGPCHDAGAFTATVVSCAGTIVGGRHHLLKLNLALRNNGSEPLILAYKTGTSGAIDELGNGYGWGRPGTHDTSTQGIGRLEGRNADLSFVLRPGESRTATFHVIRYEAARKQQGSRFAFDTVLAELRVLPNGTQSETVREHSVHLADVTVGGASSGAAAAPANLKEAADALKSLFKRKKN